MKKLLIVSNILFLPAVVFAQTNISSFISRLQSIINIIIPFLIGVAVLIIIYGIIGYVMSAGNEEKRGEAKQYIIWGIIGVAIMLSVWGLINILVNSFQFDADELRNSIGPKYVTDPGRAGIPVTELKSSDAF